MATEASKSNGKSDDAARFTAMQVALALRQLESVLVGRQEFANIAGLTFGGKRDIYDALGYDRKLTLKDYRARWERGDIAGRIVEVYPNATWRGNGWLIEEEDREDVTPFETAWEELQNRLQIWSAFRRADVLAGLGRYATILIGAPGTLDTPLDKVSADNITFLMPFAEDEMKISATEADASSVRFSLPTEYQFTAFASRSNAATSRNLVHWTRVIHVADGLNSSVYGVPRLQRPWNRLDDLDKVVGGGSEAFWKRADQGTILNMDPNVNLTPDGVSAMSEQTDEFEHGLRRMLRLRGVDVKRLGSDVADFSANAASILSLVAGCTGIPQRILLGSERGELASTQDKDNWDERVSDRRKNFAEPNVVRPFVARMIELGALPAPTNPLWTVEWPEIEKLTDIEKVDLVAKLAKVNDDMGEVVVVGSELRDRLLGWEPLTDAQQADEEGETEEETNVPRAAARRRYTTLRAYKAARYARRHK